MRRQQEADAAATMPEQGAITSVEAENALAVRLSRLTPEQLLAVAAAVGAKEKAPD